MVILVGEGSRKRVSFILCDHPPGKEQLLNVETSMALGIQPHQFPELAYTTGKKYEEEDIIGNTRIKSIMRKDKEKNKVGRN